MSSKILLSIAATGFSVAFLHAAIPTHWLPFVMAARTQKWSKAKTLGITAIAGAGHVLLTTLLGVIIVWFGIQLDQKIGRLFPIVAGGALVLFGLYYIVQHLRGIHGHNHFLPHKHDHEHHDHHHSEHNHAEEKSSSSQPMRQVSVSSDRVAVLGLITLLTFSPCEGFLPVYLSGIKFGWTGFALLSVILASATLLGMILFTWLTLIGMEKLNLLFFEKYEGLVMGGLLSLLGIGVMLFEH